MIKEGSHGIIEVSLLPYLAILGPWPLVSCETIEIDDERESCRFAHGRQ